MPVLKRFIALGCATLLLSAAPLIAFAQEDGQAAGSDTSLPMPDGDGGAQGIQVPDPAMVTPTNNAPVPADEPMVVPQSSVPDPQVRAAPVRKSKPKQSNAWQQSAPQKAYAKPQGSGGYGPNPNKFNAFLTLGLTFGNSSTATPTTVGGASVADGTGTTTSGGSGFKVGGEFNYRPDWKFLKEIFQIGLMIERHTATYAATAGASTDGVPSDSHLGIYLLPRVYMDMEWGKWFYTPWFALGLGMNFMSFGQNSGSTTTPTGAKGFAWTPRIGCDVEFHPSILAGLQFGYTRVSGSGTSTDGQTAFNISRHWFDFALRVGTQF